MEIVSILIYYNVLFFLCILLFYFLSKSRSKTLLTFVHAGKWILQKSIPTNLQNWLNYVLYTRNHVMQIFYLVLLAMGYTVYTYTVFPYMNETLFGRASYVLLIINVAMMALCSVSDAGVLTSSNVSKYSKRYCYDGFMYKKNRICETCSIVKPARSKHCSVCDVCVARFDHHCSWVNNCIGQHNHKFFILFLASLLMICAITFFLTFVTFIHIVQTRGLHVATFVDSSGHILEADFKTVTTFLFGEYPLMAFLLIYVGTIFILMLCFVCFHLFLLLSNRTTNEICKRNQVSHEKRANGFHMRRKNVAMFNENGVEILRNKSYLFGVYSQGIFANVYEVFSG